MDFRFPLTYLCIEIYFKHQPKFTVMADTIHISELPKGAEIISENGYMYTVKNVHISQISVGDTIVHWRDGHLTTICKSNLRRCSFMGRSIDGYNYKCGYELVKKVIFLHR